MFGYNSRLGLRQLRRAPLLTALIVLTLAVGVAASMSTLTVLYMMSGDPIPQKSDRLLTLTLDNYPAEGISPDEELPHTLSWIDVRNLREGGFGLRRTGLYGINAIVYPARAGIKPFFADGVAVDADFFAMMNVPFRQGSAWTATEDQDQARVVVIGCRLAEKLFGAASAVGRLIRLDDQDYRIVGVTEEWAPVPRFYRIEGTSRTSDEDQVFMPLTTALATERSVNGSTSCYEDADAGFEGLMKSECVWLRYWVELDSSTKAGAFRDYVSAYVQQQKALGRLPREDRSKTFDVRDWLAHLEVVDSDTRLQTLLAFGFLAVCLVNMVGLLLAKFTGRAADIGVRRALGATKAQIFSQYLFEAAVLGLAGSVVGVAAAFGMLKVLAAQSPELEIYARMDGTMLIATVLVSIIAAELAALLPTWRATQVVPALQLKSQ